MSKKYEIGGIEYEFSMQKHVEGGEVLTVSWTENGESFALWTADGDSLPEDAEQAAEWLQELGWSGQSDDIMWEGQPRYLLDWPGQVVVHDAESDAVYEYQSVRDIPTDWNFGVDIEDAEIIEIHGNKAHVWANR